MFSVAPTLILTRDYKKIVIGAYIVDINASLKFFKSILILIILQYLIISVFSLDSVL